MDGACFWVTVIDMDICQGLLAGWMEYRVELVYFSFFLDLDPNLDLIL
jgi:hypothetical protein